MWKTADYCKKNEILAILIELSHGYLILNTAAAYIISFL